MKSFSVIVSNSINDVEIELYKFMQPFWHLTSKADFLIESILFQRQSQIWLNLDDESRVWWDIGFKLWMKLMLLDSIPSEIEVIEGGSYDQCNVPISVEFSN